MNRWCLFTTVGYVIALAFVSLLPSGPQAPGGWDEFVPPTLQNFLHLPAYVVLTILVLACTGSCGKGRLIVTAAVVSVCLLLGMLLECLQAYSPGRTASLTDMLSNAAGVTLGLVAWRLVLAFPRPIAASTAEN